MPDPALTMSPAQRLAGYLNAIDTDADASELRVDHADLIARIYNALGAGPTVSHLTTHVATMLAGIRNNLSSDPDEAAATTEVDVLFGEVLDLLEAAYGDAGDGGGVGGVPAWVEALRAPSDDLPTLAFDFKNSRYWDGTAESTDPLSCLHEDTDWGAFDVSSITPGLGMGTLGADNNAAPVVNADISASLLATGLTFLIVANAQAGAAFDCELNQLPDYNTEYAAELFTNGESIPQMQAVNQTDNIVVHWDSPTVIGTVKSCATLAVAKLDWAYNGTAVASATPTVTPSDPWNTICLQTIGTDTVLSYIELVALYPPQPVADLLTLSAL
jgi:hypothetical protein